MITKKGYALAKRANALLFQGTRDDDILSQDLIILIEALREVARAAQTIREWDVDDHKGTMPSWKPLTQALDALPQWVVEADDGKRLV